MARKLGLEVALAGVTSYRTSARQVAMSNQAIERSAYEAAEGGQALDVSTVALGTALGNLASKGLELALRGIKKLGSELFKMVKEAGPVQGLRQSFAGLTQAVGTSAPAMLEAFRKATGGMVAQREAMRSFNKAASLVSLDFAKKLPDAMGMLSKVAMSTGESMDFLLNSLVVGVGRMSPMILDNLSIQVALSEASAEAAEMFGVQEKALTKTQKQAGLMNVVLEKLARNTANMPDVAGSATAGMASLGAIMQDTKDAIGAALLPVLSKFTGMLTTLANTVLPKLVPIFESIGRGIVGFIDSVEQLIPIGRIIEIIKTTFAELGTTIRDSFGREMQIARNFMELFGTRIEFIARLIFDRIIPSFQNFAESARGTFDQMLPGIQRVIDLFLGFFRVVDDVLAGITNLLEGNRETAKKLFVNAWETAIATVIVLLRDAANAVIKWGRALIANYSQGIISGIKEFLAGALQSVANFLKSFMAPGSPPKFLPDIGEWGAGAMNAYLEGFSSADFGLLSQFTGEFQKELSNLVAEGGIPKEAFAESFFELRDALGGVIGEFKETGKVSQEALDVIRDRLGKSGEAFAELIELNLKFRKTEEDLKKIEEERNKLEEERAKIRERESQVMVEAAGAFERGEIGAEEFEDIAKAAQDRARNEESALDTQQSALEAQQSALEAQRGELKEQLDLVQARLDFQRETEDILSQQAKLLEEMVDPINKLKGGMEDIAETVEDIIPSIARGLEDLDTDEFAFDFGKALDFGALLPDVTETREQVREFFDKALDGARQAIIKSPIAQTILNFIVNKALPFLGRIGTWLQTNIPKWAGQLQKFWEEDIPAFLETAKQEFPVAFKVISGIVDSVFAGDFKTALEFARLGFELLKKDIQSWFNETFPIFTQFKEWWDANWPIIQAVALTAWTVIKKVVLSAVESFVENAWPQLRDAFEELKEAFQTLGFDWQGVWNLIAGFIQVSAGIITGVLVGLMAIITGLATGIARAVATAVDAWAGLTENFMAIAVIIDEFLVPFKEAWIAIFEGDIPTALARAQEAFGFTLLFFQQIWDAIKNIIQLTTGTILELIQGFIDGVIGFFQNLFDNLVGESIIPELVEKIVGFFTWMKDEMVKIWEIIKEKVFVPIETFVVGLKSKIKDLVDAIAKFIDKLASVAGKKLPDWMIPGSPTPLEIGLRGIADAMNQLSTMAIPRLEASVGAIPALAGVGAGGQNIDQSVTKGPTEVNINVTLSSQQDFVKFRAMMTDLLDSRG